MIEVKPVGILDFNNKWFVVKIISTIDDRYKKYVHKRKVKAKYNISLLCFFLTDDDSS